MTFSVEIVDQGFGTTLDKAAELSARDFKPEFLRLGGQLLEEIDSQFFGERDPYGNKWTPLAEFTIQEKRVKGSANANKILQDTGTLRASFRAEVMGDGALSVFTDRTFPDGVTAAIHQFGGIHRRTNAFIPPRELLPFRDALPVAWLSWVEVYTDIGIDRIFK